MKKKKKGLHINRTSRCNHSALCRDRFFSALGAMECNQCNHRLWASEPKTSARCSASLLLSSPAMIFSGPLRARPPSPAGPIRLPACYER